MQLHFFLERHESVKKLSDCGIGNMTQLKCCVVGECNEVEVIMDELKQMLMIMKKMFLDHLNTCVSII
jgi:hypothetical protein